MIPFQAVVVRYVHDVSVDEFLNVGLVLFAPNARFAEAAWLETWTRITHAFPGAKPALLRRVTRAIDDTLARWVAEQNELALSPVANLSALLGGRSLATMPRSRSRRPSPESRATLADRSTSSSNSTWASSSART
jgi:hypothetical protein